ncbi:MAG: group II intron maturase-specific domain-containing protein [Elusimicrobiota bacterium]
MLIRDLNPVLRGWGNYFRTGNATIKFTNVDQHVEQRLRRFLMRRAGGRCKAGQAEQWRLDWFAEQGLHRLNGTVRYPNAVQAAR